MSKNPPIVPVQLDLFEDTPVRHTVHNGECYWSVVDAIAVLTESKRARKYWADLKTRIETEGAIQLSAKIGQLKMPAPDGKSRKTDAADLETLLRIIQSIPSPKAEPFKQWLAKVAVERVKEEANPDLTVKRAVRRYRALGKTDEEIQARLDGILKRNELTAEWKQRGIGRYCRYDYANLTNQLYKSVFGDPASKLNTRLGQEPKANPREAMDSIALTVLKLSESVAAAITRQDNAQGYHQCKDAVIKGGSIGRQTAENIEAALGKPLIPFAAPKKLTR